MAERKTPIKSLPVHEFRPEVPHEYQEREHAPPPRDRSGTYFIGVSD